MKLTVQIKRDLKTNDKKYQIYKIEKSDKVYEINNNYI